MRLIKPLVAAACLACTSAFGAAPPSFDRDVGPLLRTYCAGCHRDGEAESGFSVETYASLRQGGEGQGDPIAPGSPEASVLVQRLCSPGEDHMPPLDQPQPSAEAVETFKAWIAAGALPPEVDRSLLKTLAVPRLTPYSGPQPVAAAAVSPDGRRLALARGRQVEIAATIGVGVPMPDPSGKRVAFSDGPPKITALHFSGDGQRLVVAGGLAGLRGVAELRDAATGAVGMRFEGPRDLLYDAELSPDETVLATAGYDRAIQFWNVADGTVLRTINVHNGPVFDLAWHPSGKAIASASADETVKLWRASDGLRLDTLNQPQAEVQAVVFTPDGRHLAAAGRDKRIYLWDLTALDAPAINPLVQTRFAHESPIAALAVAPDGQRLFSAAEDRSLACWSLPDLQLQRLYPRQSDVPSALAAAADGCFVGRMDGSFEVAPLPQAADDEPTTPPMAAAVSPPAPPVEAANSGGAAAVEQEPNDRADAAAWLALPVEVQAAISPPGDADCYRFAASAGRPVAIDVHAARSGSRLDSRIEILDAQGRPLERVLLQAVQDSWFTFRGKNSESSGDFRLQNWMAMELDDYLYANGEIVRLWRYPRGPDSGFVVYPGFGSRHTFFGTSAVTHAMGEPAWIVRPLPPGSSPPPNGLPLFRVFYENDDECHRRLGADSQLVFDPPRDGQYVVRVTDVRGFGAESDPAEYRYTLALRPPRPSVTIEVQGKDPAVSPGAAREIGFVATRLEGFDGPVRIEVDNLPPGFAFHGPAEIEPDQFRAWAVLTAAADAADPDDQADAAVRVTAIATLGRDADGKPIEFAQDLGNLGNLQIGPAAKLAVHIEPSDARAHVTETPGEPLEFRIRPGETVTARVRVERRDFADRVPFGDVEAGRNLPFGVYVDNVGLNGLMIVEGETQREFFVTASPVARPGRRLFHLKAQADGDQCSLPVWIHVAPADELTAASSAAR